MSRFASACLLMASIAGAAAQAAYANGARGRAATPNAATPNAAAPNAAAPQAPITWTDLAGAVHRVDERPAGTVLVFGSTTCPCAARYSTRIEQLAARYASAGVPFYLVFSVPGVTADDAAAFATKHRLSVPCVLDPRAALSRRLGVLATPTAVVLDSAGKIRYRGAIDDNPDAQAVAREHLREALDALVAGKPSPVRQTFAVGCAIQGEPANAKGGGGTRTFKMEEGLGQVTFPVTTSSPLAKRVFAYGMSRWFGFNFPEAQGAFREAVRIDPNFAMGYWGIALSMGMTYNFDFDPARLPEAAEAAQKAVALCGKASPKEQALIRALAVRQSPGVEMLKQLDAYREAMAKVYYAYPDDDNIATLYAACVMDLHPWMLWSADGKPAPGTLEAILVLEKVLARNPDHLGANHYYIHATEASPHPERANASALRLGKLAPRSGHLVHMPAHTFFRTGEYSSSNGSNRRAAELDRDYFAEVGTPTQYGGYYVHNLDFLIAGYMMQGRSAEAIAASRELARVTASWAPEQAPLNCGTASGIMPVLARFAKWDLILKAPAPPEDNPFSNVMWRYARGLACIGKGDLAGARKESEILDALDPVAEKAVPEIPIPGFTEGVRGSFRVARLHLDGKLALAEGRSEDGLKLLREAILAEDALPYFEPPAWRHPVRETLGAALLKLGHGAEAERVFREELRLRKNSGRALWGLAEALKAQGKADAAARMAAEFKREWSQADTAPTLAEL